MLVLLHTSVFGDGISALHTKKEYISMTPLTMNKKTSKLPGECAPVGMWRYVILMA